MHVKRVLKNIHTSTLILVMTSGDHSFCARTARVWAVVAVQYHVCLGKSASAGFIVVSIRSE